MKHVSVTYSPIGKRWQTMVDGPQARRVAFNGSKLECIEKGKELARDLEQPLFLFNQNGYNPEKLM